MIERDCDLQTAVDILTEMLTRRVADYERYKAQLPSFGPEVDAELVRYNKAIEQYTQGTVVWYYYSPREWISTSIELYRSQLLSLTLVVGTLHAHCGCFHRLLPRPKGVRHSGDCCASLRAHDAGAGGAPINDFQLVAGGTRNPEPIETGGALVSATSARYSPLPRTSILAARFSCGLPPLRHLDLITCASPQVSYLLPPLISSCAFISAPHASPCPNSPVIPRLLFYQAPAPYHPCI